ncbi:hypothetical protein MRB53_029104 [Persea americana]|uniref:Uncharacterized protein n=1 Tax=Persea americana TaxID=3435 RepID=A0ACC2KHY0_PERAE|nr:hypothetical protein MRB53_029104 [Persea americana]|eukprot:TRINITY_DN13423_c0_g1_i1.p1 TRINITY_DN13423_c0_g1~~TRINITY_DN13423_c0_g1_i1.p1  ORF type:complete len:304 (+),score=66.95 TRINITY_DN13423_c0_g1_i1:297-1208(+)
MALRSLDNALPTTPERPKKIAKIVGPMRTPPLDSGVNDENSAPTAAIADPTPDYIASKDLNAFPDPEAILKGLLEGLNSKDWMKVCEALNNTRRLALYHSSLLIPILDKVMLVMVKAMKNPRSALCKTSIMASADIFCAFGHLLLSLFSSEAFDQLLLQLLLKASQDKKFVCEEANRALQAMTGSFPPLPLLCKLQSYVGHTNPKVRAKAAVSVSNCASKMAIDGMEEFGFVPLIRIAADLLNDRLPEAREAARSITNSVYKVFIGRDEQKMMGLSPLESWQNLCSSGLPPISAQAMVKIVPQ